MAHVLIVGAGPAGAGLAYLLARRGIEVTLLERQHDFARAFRGEFLMPSGIHALEEMGLAEPLAAVPSHRLTSGAAYLSGRLVFRDQLDPADLATDAPRAVSQPALLEMLVAESAKAPGFRLVRGAAVKALLTEGGRVTGARATTDEGEQDFPADLVIGADGRGSQVRKLGGLAVKRTDQLMDIVWCKLPLMGDDGSGDGLGVRAYAGAGHLLIGYHTWDDTLQMGWVILKGTFGELRHRGIEQWVEEMAKHVSPDFAAHLRAHASRVEKPFLLSSASDCVEHWSAPGLLVIGDAAHTMSPVGGQGINIALRDTIVAANHLVPVLSLPSVDDRALAFACRAIEDARMGEVGPIQRLQNQPPKLMLSRSWWAEPARYLIGGLLKLGLARVLAARGAGRFTHGITEVKLRV